MTTISAFPDAIVLQRRLGLDDLTTVRVASLLRVTDRTDLMTRLVSGRYPQTWGMFQGIANGTKFLTLKLAMIQELLGAIRVDFTAEKRNFPQRKDRSFELVGERLRLPSARVYSRSVSRSEYRIVRPVDCKYTIALIGGVDWEVVKA